MTVEVVAVGPGGICDAEVLRFRKVPFGYAFEGATSKVRPNPWHLLQRGALHVYQHAGVDRAFEDKKVVDGASTSLFVAAVEPDGVAVGGLRAPGAARHGGRARP